jgi:hypothetical protein
MAAVNPTLKLASILESVITSGLPDSGPTMAVSTGAEVVI